MPKKIFASIWSVLCLSLLLLGIHIPKEKISFKKIVAAAERDRPDVAAERMRW
jgi:hypothetical protein